MKKSSKLEQLIRRHMVHTDEYRDAFDNEKITRLISDMKGQAWYIKDLGHPTKQILQLWSGGEPKINFTTDKQSELKYKEINEEL